MTRLFWAKVTVPADKDQCWVWQAMKDRNGYGKFHDPAQDRRVVYAHRYSWELCNPPIPAGLTIDHVCRNRSCVNPNHLRVMTQGDNTRAGRNAQREATHCPRGHPYDDENTYRAPKTGKRNCRICGDRRTREYRQRRREQR